MKKLWRVWKYALGSFSDEKTRRYDNYIVLVRTLEMNIKVRTRTM